MEIAHVNVLEIARLFSLCNMDQTVLKFETVCNDNSNTAMIKNCTFKNLKYNPVFIYEPVTAKVPCINTTIAFVD